MTEGKPVWVSYEGYETAMAFSMIIFQKRGIYTNTYKSMQRLKSESQRVVKSGYKQASVETFTSPTEYGQRNDKRSLLFQGLQWARQCYGCTNKQGASSAFPNIPAHLP